MRKYCKTSREYFDFINKIKDNYNIISVRLTRKYVVIDYKGV